MYYEDFDISIRKLLRKVDEGEWQKPKVWSDFGVSIEVTRVDIPNKKYFFRILTPNAFVHNVVDNLVE